MSAITAITPHKKRPDEWHISLDGDYAFTLDGATVVASSLRVGQSLTPSEIERLRGAAEERHSYDAALRFLAARPRSRAEVRRRLLRRTPNRQPPEPEVVERVLERLERSKLLDDREFSEFWAEQRERFSPRAASAVRAELRQRGVSRQIADETLDAGQDEERALQAARQKLYTFARLDYEAFRAKVGQFLLRRGFAYGIARAVTRQLWEEGGGGAPTDAETFDANESE